MDRRHRRAATPTITAGPTGSVASTPAAFTYTSTEAGSTFQCQLDGAAFGACPANYTGLAQGSHTFNVRATDAAGNTDTTPATQTWTVDTVAPNTALTPLNPPTSDNTPTFSVLLRGRRDVPVPRRRRRVRDVRLAADDRAAR